ncbi:MAG: RAM signaling pathway protein-domain-containing protein [Benjaminiella poitrasii]|nr:MAG: RAM signaling pathway protein-domain-containing protein [Benjaminiella poitrasii]
MNKNIPPQNDYNSLSSNLSRTDSDHTSIGSNHIKLNIGETAAFLQKESNNNQQASTTAHIIEASQTILFTASSLQRTVGRCLGCIGNESLNTAFLPILYKLRSSVEKLTANLDTRTLSDSSNDLVQLTLNSIIVLKELCGALRTRLSILVQGLDPKFSRNLLVILYSATVDVKDAWQVISPHLSIDPINTLALFGQSKSPTVKIKSQSELTVSSHSSLSPTLSSPDTIGDNSKLYMHLRHAVTSSLHVLNTLKQSIEETLQEKSSISSSLEKKLNELLRQTQYATELSHRLDKNVEANMENNKDDITSVPNRKEISRRIWEDTSVYLKAIVSVMTFIRSISTEEDFAWPKSIKQGFLYVTRMTAEVAKLWNNFSTFAKDGFILGKQERSSSVSDPSPN